MVSSFIPHINIKYIVIYFIFMSMMQISTLEPYKVVSNQCIMYLTNVGIPVIDVVKFLLVIFGGSLKQ
jgi:hypothetical protein